MINFDETAAMLDEIAEDLPQDFYSNLNGGIYLLPDAKLHPESEPDEALYILGEYNSRHDMGSYINLYYGSLSRVYGHCSPGELRQALKRVLIHEFTHHLEFLAGERGLEIKDEDEMQHWRNRRKP